MEIFLIAGDVYYLLVDDFSYVFIYARLFFIICSFYNLFAVIYIMKKYSLWSLSYQGDIVESEIFDPACDQNLSLFFRPSTVRQSEAADMLKDTLEFRVRRASVGRATVNPIMPPPAMESLDEADDRDSEINSHL